MDKCIDDGYWQDLKTDIRWPMSWLDFANQILRRFRLVLVLKYFSVEDGVKGKLIGAGLTRWGKYVRGTHELGRCSCFAASLLPTGQSRSVIPTEGSKPPPADPKPGGKGY